MLGLWLFCLNAKTKGRVACVLFHEHPERQGCVKEGWGREVRQVQGENSQQETCGPMSGREGVWVEVTERTFTWHLHGTGGPQRVSFHFVDSFTNPEGGYYSHFRDEMGKLKLPSASDSSSK